MSDLDRLLTVDISRAAADAADMPDFASIERQGMQRRRRTSALLAAAAATVIVVVVSVGLSFVGRSQGTAPDPAPSPSIIESPTPSPPARSPGQGQVGSVRLSPEDVRNHPDAQVLDGTYERIEVVGAPGVAARVWEVCLGGCDSSDDSTWGDGRLQWALEVTRDDYLTSHLYSIPPLSQVIHASDDRFFVSGLERALVDSAGRRDAVTEGATLPITDVAGPMVSESFAQWVDLESHQLHPIAGGEWAWEPGADTWYWGSVMLMNNGQMTQRGLTWRNPDGTFDVKLLPIDDDFGYSTQMLYAGTPGVMAAVDPGPPALLHVSSDYGATWQVRTIPADVPRNSAGAIADSTLPDDWETWPIR